MIKSLLPTLLLLLLPVSALAQDDTQKEEKKNPVAIIKTSMGDITVELFADQAPKTVKNFIALAEGTKEWTDTKTGQKVKRPFYDGLIFHRVIKGFMIQGGCPLGNGQGGPGYSFADEISANSLGLDKLKIVGADNRPHQYLGIRSQRQWAQQVVIPLARKMGIKDNAQLKARWEEVKKKLLTMTFKDCFENMGYKYDDKLTSSPPKKGVLAMANAGPNTNGSQFFINLVDTPWLTGKHTVFGKVIKGMDIVDKIGGTPVDQSSRPVEAVKILSIRLVK